MKIPVTALSIVLALAACRGQDPDQAPPVGHAQGDPAAAATIAGAPAMPLPAVLPLDLDERSKRYRAATAAARHQLDSEWNRCGGYAGDQFARCRDEAVLAYDDAINHARATYGDDVAGQGAAVPGTLDNPDAIAAIQVTGTRG